MDAASFSKKFAKSLGIKDGYELRLVQDNTDVKETRHQYYQLFYRNIEVAGGHITLHSRKGNLRSAHVRIIEDLDKATLKESLTELQALDVALKAKNKKAADLKEKLPKGNLVLTQIENDYVVESYRLAYVFEVRDNEIDGDLIYVDAASGKVLKKIPLVQRCFDPTHAHGEKPQGKAFGAGLLEHTQNAQPLMAGTFNNLFPRGAPTPTLEVERTNPASLSDLTTRLTMSTTRSQALDTRFDNDNNRGWNDEPLTNATSNWGNNQQLATLAHWTTWRTNEYFRGKFGFNGTNGSGNIARVLIAPNEDQGAFWTYLTNDRNNGIIVLGRFFNNAGFAVSPVLSAVDIVAHEYGHGISAHLVNGWSNNIESRSLNEGFSDIIGSIIERELLPNGGPNGIDFWRIGEDAFLIRNMANPHQFGQPQTYGENGFWLNNPPPNNPHHNSSVLSKWFHTLITGNGPTNTITAIDSYDKAVEIVYWALDNYIFGDYNYPNLAGALIQASTALYGECSPQQIAVRDALNAVGLNGGVCTPDCNFRAAFTPPTNIGCGQTLNLNASCTNGPGWTNSWTCYNVHLAFSGPNVPGNSAVGNNNINVTAPSTPGTYQYTVVTSKPNSTCYVRPQTVNITVSCQTPNPCDFTGGPRYVGTWAGLTVQIRNINGQNILVTAITGSNPDKYYPRGDNFWDRSDINKDPNAVNLGSCLNGGSTGWGGLGVPAGLTPPPGYSQGQESDGAIFFVANGGTPPPNPCDFGTPRRVGTWNNMIVQIRQFPNGKQALVTAEVNSSNDKYFPRGDNFWDNFTKDSGVDQYRSCLNAGETGWWGLVFPNVSPPPGYQQGQTGDGATFFSTNGARVATLSNAELPAEGPRLVRVRPNPAQTELTVTFDLREAQAVPMRFLDVSGKAVLNRSYQGTTGKNEQVIDVSALPTGVYMLEVLMDQQRIVQKVIKD
ncbi:MAG: T9SS C-terminal target domain-containing protein [Cytophagales bacterium]|nr:MAG: T9SS C-terminal target domain-containing protein [Cytophagales bacterium]